MTSEITKTTPLNYSLTEPGDSDPDPIEKCVVSPLGGRDSIRPHEQNLGLLNSRIAVLKELIKKTDGREKFTEAEQELERLRFERLALVEKVNKIISSSSLPLIQSHEPMENTTPPQSPK